MACLRVASLGCDGGAGDVSVSGTFIPGGVGEIAFWDTATTIGGETTFTYIAATNNAQIGGGFIVNEDGGALATDDFRVEGDTLPNLILVDSSADTIFITDSAVAGTPPTVTGGFAAGTLLALVNNSVVGDSAELSLIGGTSSFSGVNFGDSGDEDIGMVQYFHATDSMLLSTAAVERQSWSASEVVINETGTDTDFRVEADTGASKPGDNSAAMFVEASSGRIGIGTASPSSQYHVQWASADTFTFDAPSGVLGNSLRMVHSRGSLGARTQTLSGDVIGRFSAAGWLAEGFAGVNANVDFVAGANLELADMSIDVHFTPTSPSGVNVSSVIAAADRVVINEGGIALDFRAEGDTLPNLLFLDASADRVFITDAATGGTPPVAPTGGYSAGALLVLQNNSVNTDTAELSLIGGANAQSVVNFGDTDDENIGEIQYAHATNIMFLTASTVERQSWGATEVVVNDTGADTDFRVEGDTDASLFVANAGTDFVGIGEPNPAAKLHIVTATTPQVRLGSTAASNNQNSTILGIATSSSDFISQTVANDTVLMAKSTGHIYFASSVSGAQVARVIFARGGNVGINNMTPNNPLTVSETSPGTPPSGSLAFTAVFHDNAAAGGVGQVGIIGGNSGQAVLSLGQSNDAEPSRVQHDATTSSMRLWTNGGVVQYITSTGQFGFNTGATAPDTTVRFEVSQLTGDTIAAWRQIAETAGNSVEHAFVTGAAGSALAATNQLGKIKAEITQGNPSALAAFMSFEVNASDTIIEPMRFTGSLAVAGTGEVVVNEIQADIDFRVESDTAANLLLCDAGTNRVGILASTPAAQLHVSQLSTTAAIPVIILDQDDTSEPFIDFEGGTGADVTSSISTLTTSGAVQGHIQIDVNGTKRWLAILADPS
jgi:hypothetical protein